MVCELLDRYGSCGKCMSGAPFRFCCRKECGEHSFCKVCIEVELEKQMRLKQKKNNERKDETDS